MAQHPDSSDRYRRLQPLGEGGAGRVWMVEDTLRPGRRLALKELAESSSRREESLRGEFATLAALRHPNLVEVHDFRISPLTGLPEFTLEHVDTGTTATLFNRPGVPPSSIGCSGNDIDNTVDDEATLTFENDCTSGANPTQAYLSGEHYQGGDPPGPVLAAFDGEDYAGGSPPW